MAQRLMCSFFVVCCSHFSVCSLTSYKFDQPVPYAGNYDLTNPQSFDRYSYVRNDPVNFVDPTGLDGVLGGWIGITLNPRSGSVTVTASNNPVGGFLVAA